MSVQVSYKNQFVLFLFLLITLLLAIEIFVNFWLYNFYSCDFESNEIFQEVDPETKRKICLENLGFGFTKQSITRVEGAMGNPDTYNERGVVHVNLDGFRGPEVSKEKPLNTYRIITIGGSTTFGNGVIDKHTYPFFLQKLFDQTNFGVKIEIINAGWPFEWSLTESNRITSELLDYEPDLFIVYDGANEIIEHNRFQNLKATAPQWKQRWMEICDLGNQLGFDTIVTLQPLVTTGKKILTLQEHKIKLAVEKKGWLDNYSPYFEQLDELKNHCTLTADLSNIFDHVEEPIYFDPYHTGHLGNKIIAEKFYVLSLPIVKEGITKGDFKMDSSTDYLEEIDSRILTNDFNGFTDEFYYILRDIVSSYKTPRIYTLFS